MLPEPPIFAVRGRWVFPIVSAPIRNGCVTIQDGRIIAVGLSATCPEVKDLGDVAILPGLVNAHTHLEFSDLDRPLGQPGMTLTAWLRQVVSLRRSQAEAGEDLAAIRAAAVTKGLEESRAAGVSCLGEIASPAGWSQAPFRDSPLRCVVFQELLGLTDDRSETLLPKARLHLALGAGGNVPWVAGLSPHAPYTVRLDVVQRICRLSQEQHVPIAMHLAESLDELRLLKSADGPLVQFLEELDAWDPEAVPRGIRPINYLRQLATARRSLVIHGNYLSYDEICFAGSQNDRMSVAYCPRTHEYFGHAPYPLQQMLDARVNVCLGTDSRASNPDLSLWDEMRTAAYRHPDVSPEDILKMGTINGAQALGFGNQTGVLVRGRRADLTLIRLSNDLAYDPWSSLFDNTQEAVTAFADGESPQNRPGNGSFRR